MLIRPPSPSTICLQMARPKPVPFPAVLVVKKGSQMRRMTSAGMPGPLSETVTSTSPSGAAVDTVMTPLPLPDSMACLALTSRFNRTCWISARDINTGGIPFP